MPLEEYAAALCAPAGGDEAFTQANDAADALLLEKQAYGSYLESSADKVVAAFSRVQTIYREWETRLERLTPPPGLEGVRAAALLFARSAIRLAQVYIDRVAGEDVSRHATAGADAIEAMWAYEDALAAMPVAAKAALAAAACTG